MYRLIVIEVNGFGGGYKYEELMSVSGPDEYPRFDVALSSLEQAVEVWGCALDIVQWTALDRGKMVRVNGRSYDEQDHYYLVGIVDVMESK